jgi:hypothetical protein
VGIATVSLWIIPCIDWVEYVMYILYDCDVSTSCTDSNYI